MGVLRIFRGHRQAVLVGQLGVLVVWLSTWQLVGRTQPVLLSAPTEVASTFLAMVQSARLPELLVSSGRTFVLGWVLAVGSGIVIGVMIGWSRPVALMFEPFVNALYSTPLIALVPLMVLWFGLGVQALVACVTLVAVFPILVMTIAGVRNAGREYVEVAKSFRLSSLRTLYLVVLPGALPYMMVGLRLTTARAITGTIIAEFLIGGDGIGDALQNAGNSFQSADAYSFIITIAAFAMLVDVLVRRTGRVLAPS